MTMKFPFTIFCLSLCACAAPIKQEPTEGTEIVRPQLAPLPPVQPPVVLSPSPVFVPTSNGWWHLQFPPGADPSLYAWRTLITDDLTQPMTQEDTRYEWQGDTLVIHTQGMQNVFIEMEGTPQQ